MADPLDKYEQFARLVGDRLLAGRTEYGDKSFSKPREELVREVSEELLDVCAWSYILWVKVQSLDDGGLP